MATTVLTSNKASIGRGSWESQPCRVDITGWEKKVRNVKEVQARVCKEVVDWAIKQLFDRTVQNVTAPGTPYGKKGFFGRGPLTNAGKLPIPIFTGQLRRSIKHIRFNTVFGAVYSDKNVAAHNEYVHNGTRYMRPRPFLQAAVDQERPRILEFMKKRILEEVQKAGGQGSLF